MIFKKYYFNILVRIILMGAMSLLIAYYLVSNGPDISFIILSGIFILQVYNLISWLNRTNKTLTFFFDAIKNEDSSLVFSEKTGSRSFDELHTSLNLLNNKLKEARMDIIIQEKFYQSVVESAATALVVFDCEGQVRLANKAVKDLLGISFFNNISQLQRTNSRMSDLFMELVPGESKTINIMVNGNALYLSLYAVCINIRNEEVKLVALHDISRELDKQEIDSWQKLIRILNHEIMNSVAPITSLSATLSGFFTRDGVVTDTSHITEKTIADTIKGLSVIENHGRGLINFVESYRSLTKLPRPQPKDVKVLELFERVSMLSASLMPVNESGERKRMPLSTQVTPLNLIVFADEELMIRVLFNLVKNAFESFEELSSAVIFLESGIDRSGKVWMKVTDNGPGIPPEIQNNIFIPFFTTKDGGNGIGLSLSRQIMSMHKGKISLNSFPGEGATFLLQF